MGILMLINWFKILCLTTAFCVCSLIFGAHFMLGSTEREEFTSQLTNIRKSTSQHQNTVTLNTHNARVSSYHHRRHLPTLAPSYLVLMVNLGFATEQ